MSNVLKAVFQFRFSDHVTPVPVDASRCLENTARGLSLFAGGRAVAHIATVQCDSVVVLVSLR